MQIDTCLRLFGIDYVLPLLLRVLQCASRIYTNLTCLNLLRAVPLFGMRQYSILPLQMSFASKVVKSNRLKSIVKICDTLEMIKFRFSQVNKLVQVAIKNHQYFEYVNIKIKVS